MTTKYLNLVEISDSFLASLTVKITDDLEKDINQHGPGYEYLLNALKSKAIAEKIQNDISLKNADKEITKTRRSLERQDKSIVGNLDLTELSGQYIKLRALAEKFRLNVRDIERMENLPHLNMAVQQYLMKELKFEYEVEKDRNASLYTDMKKIMSETSSILEPMLVRPALEENNIELVKAVLSLVDPMIHSAKEIVRSARKALSISPYCLPAYGALLEKAELIVQEKLALTEKGIYYLEEFFGKKYIENFKGRFCENNPEGFNYMIVRYHHATALMSLEKYKETERSIIKSIEYDENDNFGLRYLLVSAYCYLKNFKAARKLILRYNSDEECYWAYTKVLIEFMDKGDNESSRSLLESVRKRFPLCWDFLQKEKLELNQIKQKITAEVFMAYDYATWNRKLWKELGFCGARS